MMENEQIKGVHFGSRDDDFKTLIMSVLKKGNIKEKYIEILTNSESMEKYAKAFTSDQVDINNNYQVYEQLGDLIANKFIVCYIYDRFPQLNCSDAVKIVARLRINYGSKNTFSQIAEELGFWNFITATNETRERKKKDLLEDVFEAFLGATENILDKELGNGVGYACVYKILKGIFDTIPISLRYEDLYDAKTRLKELFDIYNEVLGPLMYQEFKDEEGITHSTAFRYQGAKYETRPDGTINMNKIQGQYIKVPIGKGSANLKDVAQQLAAADALKTLAAQGYIKYAPRIYAKFDKESTFVQEKKDTTEEDIIKLLKGANINDQVSTRNKSKYQYKYTSTVLGKYCTERDYEGIEAALKMGASINARDSEDLTCLDLLLIGSVDEEFIKKVLKRFIQIEKHIDVHENVVKAYFSKYSEKLQKQAAKYLHILN